jgi:His-Xaa-Ser system radical SAM maturase HxsC
MTMLRGRANQVERGAGDPPRILRLSIDANRPAAMRQLEGYLSRNGDMPPGFACYVKLGNASPSSESGSWAITLPEAFSYLDDGDIMRVGWKNGDVETLYQMGARHHTFLLTERCNHYCLMCSQPPRNVQDGWIVDDMIAAIPLIDPTTPEILFTGGEPTLLGDNLIELTRRAGCFLPTTGLHILTNGRSFIDDAYAARFASVKHHDLMFGIPIYSDLSDRHDYIVQADGAFDETIRGILNLKRHGLRVEIRVVVHKQSYERLPQLARFIARNLTFVDQVVFMGLEMSGFTKANLEALWIDPLDYRDELAEAVHMLADSRIHTSIYNQQLCVTHSSLWPYARQSISDWKNEYMDECDGCAVQDICGGFFASAKLKYSRGIKAQTSAAPAG